MNELDLLIEKHYKKRKEEVFSMESLLEIVSGVYNDLEVSPSLKEEASSRSLSSSGTKEMTVTVSMIPDIEVSELGWADVRTPENGAPIKGRERQILEDYLNNIVGPGGIDTLPRKLEALSDLAENPERFISTMGPDKTPGEKIRTVISFLVFYKTLTKIVANFNASSAGFSFESFLATLLNGIQIPASGADTIADFEDVDGVRVSLKLYNERTLEVGGSFPALVGDLVADEKMTYLAVTKKLRGSREKLDGELTFYKFDFTLDNVMEILADSKAISARCVVLPLEQFSGEDLPARISTAPFLQDKFNEYLKDDLQNEDILNKLLNNPSFKYGSEDHEEITTGTGKKRQFTDKSPKGEALLQILRGIFEESTEEETIQIGNSVVWSSRLAFKDLTTADKERKTAVARVAPSFSAIARPTGSLKSKENKAIKDKWIAAVMEASKKSEEFYEPLSTEDKKKALLRTNGYLNNLQFSLNKEEVIRLSKAQSRGASPSIGTLTIGMGSLQKMLDSSIKALNTDVFSVFSHLQTLGDSLNSFFAGGLADTKTADRAIENADAIEGKTTEMKK